MARTKTVVAEGAFASGLEHLTVRVKRARLRMAAYATRLPAWGRRGDGVGTA
jgi:hypothetical protein